MTGFNRFGEANPAGGRRPTPCSIAEGPVRKKDGEVEGESVDKGDVFLF